MKGKVCLVTGSTSGIGKVTALELARMGATVVLVARDPDRGKAAMSEIKAATGNMAVGLLLADLASLSQVRLLARRFLAGYQRLHVLINNAGTIFPACATTEDGLETTFSVNHLAPFLLTNLLLDILKESRPARIVNLASAAHYGTIDFENLQGQRHRQGLWAGWRAYNQSKLANILFTYELARRLEGTGVTANCVHPGMVATHAGHYSKGILASLVNRYRPCLISFFLNLPRTFLLTPEQGAATSLYLGTSPEVEGMSGKYFINKAEAVSSGRSYDRSLAQRLWNIDTEMTGLHDNPGP